MRYCFCPTKIKPKNDVQDIEVLLWKDGLKAERTMDIEEMERKRKTKKRKNQK